jgi:hypothetical protein
LAIIRALFFPWVRVDAFNVICRKISPVLRQVIFNLSRLLEMQLARFARVYVR